MNWFNFFISIMSFVYIGRKVGWFLTKYIFIVLTDGALLRGLLVTWGFITFRVVMQINDSLNPNIFVFCLVAIPAGLYVAQPAYALFSSFTHEQQVERVRFINFTPLVVYVCLLILAFVMRSFL